MASMRSKVIRTHLMLGTMTKENTEFVQKSMKMDVMELKLYSVNNISMHYPES